MYTNVASAVGLDYLWIPFMLLAIYLSLLNFDFELLEVAKVCGARPWRAFLEVTWPLNWMGTAIGIVLVFIPTFAASVTPRFLGGPNGAMFGNRLEHQFGATGNVGAGFGDGGGDVRRLAHRPRPPVAHDPAATGRFHRRGRLRWTERHRKPVGALARAQSDMASVEPG